MNSKNPVSQWFGVPRLSQRSKKSLGVFFVAILATTTVLIFPPSTRGATFTFNQSSWLGGLDGGTRPSHPSSQTGWSKYDAKDAEVAASSQVSLALTNGTAVQTSSSDFGAGTASNLSVGSDLKLGVASSLSEWAMAQKGFARQYSAATWDPINFKAYIFGGQNGRSRLNDMWAFTPSTNTLVDLNATNSPSIRYGMTLVWDTANNRILMFGGNSVSGNVNELWSYSPSTNAWTQLSPTGTAPTARYMHSAVWDSVNNQMLIFGGQAGNAVNDLWSYSPSTNAWTQLSPTGTAPTARYMHSAVWDSVNNQMLLFSGSNNVNDLWSYSPSTNAWTQLSPTGTAPAARRGHSAVWDSQNNRMLIFAGVAGSYTNDLWSYSPSTNAWTQLSPTGSVAVKYVHSAVWDSQSNRMYSFTGYTGQGYINSIYSFDPAANTHSLISVTGNNPIARTGGRAVWDDLNNRMLVFGGADTNNPNQQPTDLWAYSNISNTWTLLNPSGTPPTGRTSFSAVWDDQNDRMLIFSGNGTNTIWAYSSASNSWAQLSPTGTAPAARSTHSAVWDSQNNRMLVFGGNYSGAYRNDLWAYTPSTNAWTQLSPTGTLPAIRGESHLAWDSLNNRMLVFGGYNNSYLNDLWAYTPSTNAWAQLSPTGTLPSARKSGVSVWDEINGRMLVFGGTNFGGRLNELWSYTVSTNAWVKITPAGTAPQAADIGLGAWDNSTSKLNIFGGSAGTDELWQYVGTVTFTASGTLTSSVMDLGQKNFIGNLGFTATVPAPTTLKFQLRSASTSGGVSSATWYGPTGTSDYYTTANTAINSVHNGDRYFQYKAFLDTTNTGYTPTLSDITINFTYYPSAGTLTSSAFNTNDSANALTKLEWTATKPASTDVKFQVRTAPNSAGVPGTWGSWMGPDGTNGTYFSDATGAEAMPADVRDGSNDQWIQYKMFLSTTDGMVTPSVAGVVTSYLVNSQPTVTNVTAAQGSNGAVAVTYDTDDGDNATLAVSLGVDLGITLSGSITSGAATLLVSDAAKLPSAGSIFIDTEEISYASKSVNTLSGLVRARNNTYAAAHNDAAKVYLKATSVSGNVGSSVAIGTAKQIAWNVATDIANLNTSTAQVRVFVNDGSLANQVSSAASANFSIDTTPPSTVSSTFLTRATAKSSSSMEISWTTDKASNSIVEYGTTLSYGLSAQDDALVTSHAVTLTGLTANTLYYFKVKSIDAVNNTVIDDNNGDGFTFITPEANGSSAQQNDTTPPVISAVSVKDVTTTSATVVWTTDEEASTIVNYGNSSAYGSLAGVPDIFTKSHTAILANLLPGATYHFQIVSLDRSGNRSASANNTLTTQSGTGTGTGTGDGTGTGTATDQQLQDLLNQKAALDTQISELQAQLAQSGGPDAQQKIDQLRLQLAELQVKIDAANKMKAEYEAMKIERDQAVVRAEKAEAALNEITDKILGIKEGDSLSPAEMLKIVITKFQYFTRLFKSSATAEEKQQLEGDLNDTSTTLKDLASLVPPPKILTKPAIEIGADQAIISWNTDKATKGYVAYATDELFKQSKEYTLKAGSDDLTKEHKVTLSGLMPATTYHYQVQSASESGAANESSDFTFTTKESAAVISSARITKLSEKSAKVNWLSSIPASSMVTYTPVQGGNLDTQNAKTQGTPGLSKEHEVVLNDLVAGTIYSIEIASTDIFGNTVNSKLGNLITAEDKTAPEINQLRTETSIIPGAKNKIQVFVTWKTSEPATSQVVFTKGSANANSKFDGQSQDNDELTYNHTAVITNWDPGALYSFKAVSKDEFGNVGYSKIYVVLTPKPKATIVDVILDNFANTFGWTKKIGQ